MAHDHAHDHGHHHGDSRTDMYLEQLFTIGISGALAAVTFMLWFRARAARLADRPPDGLTLMLSERLHIFVLLGSLGLFVLVLIRAVAVWRSVGEPALKPVHTHSHDHEHEHKHDHDQACCDHEHGHD